ncbi:acyl carrier protein [Nonomuraea deserti]|uniref:Acyl carrier protein n=1 Tax=Nonomuraea deserti TaxID=1848322 RepID=A0A4R4UH82_9ACTN|nr:phosphopantetheine-binding protein [Nonomuraea deserti]TDC88032.1 acyl carrier protein [Nonomuraea deserti]
MSEDDIATVVREHCVRILKVDPGRVTGDALLREDLEADSLDLAELHVALEDRWGPLPRETLADVRTVGDVIAKARLLLSGSV